MLATDLDGTLIGSANEFPLYSNFRDKTAELRRNYGTIWVACTGRSLSSFKSFFSPMRMMGLMPDFVIVNHAYIYEIKPYGCVPHIFWNLRIRYLIWASKLFANQAINEWHDMITSVSIGVSTIRRKKERLCLRFDSEESANVAADLLKEKTKPYPHFQVFRFFKEVEVVSVPFTKGLALSELARHLQIPASEIMAIGNGHNDISMMSRKVAHMTGCPSNSEPQVIEAVGKEGGHIARSRSLGGVLEILDAYQAGTVCSDPPSGWVPPEQRNGAIRRGSRSGRKNSPRVVRSWLMIVMVVYVVLTVLASFNLIPFVSQAIIKPYRMLMSLVEKIVFMFWH